MKKTVEHEMDTGVVQGLLAMIWDRFPNSPVCTNSTADEQLCNDFYILDLRDFLIPVDMCCV